MEKNYNQKVSFFKDKENMLEENLKSIEKIKQENNNLYIKIKELETKNHELNSKHNTDNKNPIKLYKTPTLIGLNNIGATCFMNATLQCLSQTKKLTNYFLKQYHKDTINKNDTQLCSLYYELIKNLWKINGEQSFSPYDFMNAINEMNPLFKLGQAGDSKDFIIFILERLHNELKKPTNRNNNDLVSNENLNQYDKKNAFNHFFFDFQNSCSIISDIFFGMTETTNECLFCKYNYNSKNLDNPICYNYQIFNCLIFPLEEVKNMKNNSMINNNNNNNYNYNIYNNNNTVSLYDCFYYNQKTELFTGENKNYCNLCKKLYDSMYTSKIYICPNVLILILNRGKGNIFKVKLDFSETIDITQFVIEKDMPQIIYSLYGVITHIGQSGPNAHFIAACKSPIDNKWYRYNDAFVTPITNIKNDVIDYGIPYILFYQKNKIK